MTRPAADRDRGLVTVWALALTMILLFFGFAALDLWAGFSERRQLAAAADQAAQAGANALDTATFRTSGIRQLDPDQAEALAWQSLAEQDLGPIADADVSATADQITVVLHADVDSGLMTIFDVGGDSLRVTVTAVGFPGATTP